MWAIRSACVAAVLLGAVAARADVVNVDVIDFDFSPDPTIHVGDTIHWVWDPATSFPHTTTSAAGLSEFWDSGVHSAPYTYDYTFTQVGEFDYYCTLHGLDLGDGQTSGMAGTITVVPEPAAMALLALALPVVLKRRKWRLGRPGSGGRE